MDYDAITAYNLNNINAWGQAVYANSESQKSQERSFAQQNNLLTQEQQYNTQMWSLNNAYNAPSAQMQRLREAGINPNMAFMQGTDNTAQAATSPSAPGAASSQGIAPQSDQVGWMNFAIQNKELQLKNRQLDLEELRIKSQNQVNESVIKKNQAESEYTNIMSDQSAWTFNTRLENLVKEGKLTDARCAQIQSEMQVANAKIGEMNAHAKELLASAKNINWQTFRGHVLLDLEKQKLNAEVRHIAMSYVDLLQQAVLHQFQAERTAFDINLDGAQLQMYLDQDMRLQFDLRLDEKYADYERQIQLTKQATDMINHTVSTTVNVAKAVKTY